jgi:hypothetical protein
LAVFTFVSPTGYQARHGRPCDLDSLAVMALKVIEDIPGCATSTLTSTLTGLGQAGKHGSHKSRPRLFGKDDVHQSE